MSSFIDMLRQQFSSPSPVASAGGKGKQPTSEMQATGHASAQGTMAAFPTPDGGFGEDVGHGFPGGGVQPDHVGNMLAAGLASGALGLAGIGTKAAEKAVNVGEQGVGRAINGYRAYGAPDEAAADFRNLANHVASTGKGWFRQEEQPVVDSVKYYLDQAKRLEATPVGARLSHAFEVAGRPVATVPQVAWRNVGLDASRLLPDPPASVLEQAAWENTPWGSSNTSAPATFAQKVIESTKLAGKK